MARFFKFLKTAQYLISIALKVVTTMLAAYEATQADTAGA